MSKINVFGGTGFIGKRFCGMYPQDVIVSARDRTEPLSSNILYLISTTHNYNDMDVDIETNILWLSKVLKDTKKCMDRYKQPFTFNFISSWFVYGYVSLPAKEDEPIKPRLGYYTNTKVLAEKLVMRFCSDNNINWRIFRLANVFGIGDKFSKQKNALQYLINEMRYNRPISLYYGGNFVRDYIHVNDVCSALYQGMLHLPTNDIYNIGSGIPIRFKDIIFMARTLLGSSSDITLLQDAPEFHNKVSEKDFWMDISKAKKYGIFNNSSPYEKLVRMLLDED